MNLHGPITDLRTGGVELQGNTGKEEPQVNFSREDCGIRHGTTGEGLDADSFRPVA